MPDNVGELPSMNVIDLEDVQHRYLRPEAEAQTYQHLAKHVGHQNPAYRAEYRNPTFQHLVCYRK